MNYGFLRLVTAHLPGGRPSCKKRRGSRTRRQPSSRHARRCGFPRGQACETRLPTNKKTPASPGDAGVMERGRCVSAGEARPASTPIRVTMDCVVSRAVVLIRLTRFRSMLCLGRNLITVFQGVNTCAQLFSFSRPDLIATANTWRIRTAAPCQARFAALRRTQEKKHRENALFLHRGQARR